jgi:predicted transcriptional regulator
MVIMPVISCYDRYSAEIQKLFNSSICIKILLALNGNPAPKAALCALTGNAPAALQAKLKHLEEAGRVRSSGGSYTLTAAGALLAPKIASVIGRFAGTPSSAGGASSDQPSAVLGAYGEHMRDIHMVLRSSLLTRMLLLLREEPMTRDRFRECIGCSSPNFRANIKKLIDIGLVNEEGYHFSLAPRGVGIARGLEEFFLTYAVVAEHRAFWEEHSLEGLPGFALETIGDLQGSDLIHDTPVDYFSTYASYLDIIARAKCIHGVTTLANPGVADAIGARVAEGYPAELVISPDLAMHLHEEPYADRLKALASYPHLQFFVTTLPISLGLTVTHTHLSMKLYLADGITYDAQNGLVSTSPGALAWGERLFQHYKRHAVPIEEFMRSPPKIRPDSSSDHR